LVAVAVLAIIVLVTAQIMSSASTLTTRNNEHMDADDQARTVFDRMANDFARMVKRSDVDFIFWKNTPAATPTTGVNDVMYFYTEGAGYFDTANTFTTFTGTGATSPYGSEKNSVSLVGYRVNNNNGTFPTTASPDVDYYQLERLGKSLAWDGGAWNPNPATAPNVNSKQPNVMTFLTYPAAGTDVGAVGNDPSNVKYSTAFFLSTLAGAFSNNGTPGALPCAVGTKANAFNDSADTAYRTLGSQVFRFEYSFQLKDGTFSDKPIMVATTSNGIPSSNFDGTTTNPGAIQRPLPTNDSSTITVLAGTGGSKTITVGTRWWDRVNHIGYICLDATKGYAIWHEIGVQDVSAIIVTIAVIDKQGLVYVNAKGGDLSKIASAQLDYSPTVNWPIATSPAGNPAYLLDPTKSTAPISWAYALLPGGATGTVSTIKIVGTTKLPQSMISKIRLYQRYFYLNTF